MLQASYTVHNLEFKRPSGTSRGVLVSKPSWYIQIWDYEQPTIKGIGECSIIEGLSIDNVQEIGNMLDWICQNINLGLDKLLLSTIDFPAISFALETAFLDLSNGGKRLICATDFYNSGQQIPINGLIWMGDKSFMYQQVKEKIEQGFECIKLKIGSINFEDELEILQYIRSQFSAKEIELRVDANGAFSPNHALEKLKQLSDFDLHSIEQPIQQGQANEMAYLCQHSPLPIALDEELIGIHTYDKKKALLRIIQPQYIILKPSLLGGFASSTQWIQLAQEQSINWWITSALESNIGLNAIAQWTSSWNNPMPQGLGTGALFTNNIAAPLVVEKGFLKYDKQRTWDIKILQNV